MNTLSRPIILVVLNEETKIKFAKLIIIRKIKKILKTNFKINFSDFKYNDSIFLTFEKNVNNNKFYNLINKLCYEYDINFKYLSNKKIELIY